MPDIESVSFEIDPRSVIGALQQMNTAVEGFEKGGANANQRLQDSFERVSKVMMNLVDKQYAADKRLVLSNEMRAATYGREITEVQRLTAQRDEYNKRLGNSADLLVKNNAAFEQMISKAKEFEGGGKFKEFGENIAQFIEQPMLASKGAVTGFLESMGPVGGAVAGAAAGLAAFAAAGYEAAKSVGEASARMRDVEIRMGVTDKQAAELGFSAKAAGADVSVFERAMRGLTTAVEGTGTEGAKARQELTHFGVDIAGLKNGTAGTYDTLIKISEGLGAMSSPFERSAAGMDIFKRAYFEMAPALMDLRENSQYFQEHGLAVWTDADSKKGLDYLRWATDVENRWNNIKLHIESAVAGAAQFLAGGGAGAAHPAVGTPAGTQTDIIEQDWQRALRQRGIGPMAPPSADAAISAGQIALNAEIRQQAALKAAYDATEDGLKALVSAAKKSAEEATTAFFDPDKGTRDILQRKNTYLATQQDYQREKDRLEIFQQRQKDAEERQKIPMGPMPSDFYNFSLVRDVINARNSGFLAQHVDELKPDSLHGEGEDFLKGLRRDAQQLTQEISTLDKGLKFSREADLSRQESAIRVNGILGGRDAGIDTDRQMTAAKRASLDDQYRFELQEVDAVAAYIGNADDRRTELRMQHAKDVSELEMKLAEQVAEETRKQFDSIKQVATSLWETALTHPQNFGKQLRDTLHSEIIKPVAEGLGGMTAQILQPIVYGADGHGGISGAFKGTFGGFNKPLDPLHGALDSNAGAVRQNTGAIIDLAAEFRAARSFSGGGGGGNYSIGGGTTIVNPGFGGGSSTGPGGGYSSGGWGTNIFNPDFSGGIGYGGGGGVGFPGAPGGTSDFDGPVFQTGTTAAMPGGRSPFARIFGGGTHSAGAAPWGGLLSGFKDSFAGLKQSFGINGPIKNTAGWDPETGQPTFSTSGGTSFSSVIHSPGVGAAAGAAGTMLFDKGALGGDRGTKKGIGMDALGGAGIGLQYGGPLGAVIGAAVGAGVGLGEHLAGVETPENKAKRLAKSIYGLNIDNQMAQQIAQMAQSKYGSDVTLAMRSPEVRQMLGIYAAGTGQKMPMGATTPMGGSLAEQGGQLYQQAMYQYGKSYSYQSPLSTLGGPTSGSIPSPSQNISLSLNVGGADMQSFMAGNVFTPEATQSNLEAAWNAGNGRVSSSAAMQGSPNLIV